MAQLEIVKNKDRKFGADTEYLRLTLDNDEVLLFTEEQIKLARQRAKVNPEDCIEVQDAVDNDFWRAFIGG
jgi:hypothetical protein